MAELLYTQMRRILRQHPQFLQHYRTDFSRHDRDELRRHGRGVELLWLVRENGSELFAIAHGKRPEWITYWLSYPHKVFRLRVGRVVSGQTFGTIDEIGDDKAVQLARRAFGAKDHTECARQRGYKGSRPVLVRDGLVESHGFVPWEEFLEMAELGKAA